jgi:hypothetical protein
MGTVAVLAGIGIAVYGMVMKKTPLFKAKAQAGRLSSGVEAWKRSYKSYPPSDLNKLGFVSGSGIKIQGRVNGENGGIEALYQALFLTSVEFNPDVQDSELGNLDDDRLDKSITKGGSTELKEILDPWNNPWVYFAAADYEAAEKAPPTYSLNEDSEDGSAQPKPWRVEGAPGSKPEFAQPGAFQLYSMGPDGKPNTEDDVKAWER